MSEPIDPNFTPGAGRLATDRFAYEKHINGTANNHKASQIELFPTVVIGTAKNNVQDAISAISSVIGTPPPDATTLVKGIIRLTGDISGTATNVIVTKLQSKPISSLTPNLNDVLTWDGSSWKPQSILGSFANLNVTGNTILGTNSANTLLINAQTTISNNLSVSGNTNLGNAGSDTITITGSLGATSPNITLNGTTNVVVNSPSINLNSSGNLGLNGTSIGIISGYLDVNISGITNFNSSTRINFTSPEVRVTSATDHVLISPQSYTKFESYVEFANNKVVNILNGSNLNLQSQALMTINCPVYMSSFAKMNMRYNILPNSNTNIYPGLFDMYIAFSGDLSGNRTYTINETTPPATIQGYQLEIVNNSGRDVTIKNPVGTTLTVLSSSGQVGYFYRNSGQWILKYKLNTA